MQCKLQVASEPVAQSMLMIFHFLLMLHIQSMHSCKWWAHREENYDCEWFTDIFCLSFQLMMMRNENEDEWAEMDGKNKANIVITRRNVDGCWASCRSSEPLAIIVVRLMTALKITRIRMIRQDINTRKKKTIIIECTKICWWNCSAFNVLLFWSQICALQQNFHASSFRLIVNSDGRASSRRASAQKGNETSNFMVFYCDQIVR